MVPRTLTYAEARRRVLQAARPGPVERVPLAAARARALRETLLAPHALPPFDNAQMDGWAVRPDDLVRASNSDSVTLDVVEVIPAGHPPTHRLGPGQAARIMTGAMLPAGAGAVIAFEDAEGLELPARVRVTRPAQTGENVRREGDDLAAGDVVLEQGRELSPHDLALLAALGFGEVPVGACPAVSILSTGDELLGPDDPPRPGAIRESNVPQLSALLEECGCRLAAARRLPDDVPAVAAAIRESLAVSDVVLTIGGVSAGDFDPVRDSLQVLDDIEWWRVAMRPGRPQAFGAPGGRLFFGLPGNPGSVACVFETLVRPALRRLHGFTALDRPWLDVRAAERIESDAGRTDFVRATLARRDGAWWAAPAGRQVSGHLTPQSRAHALIVVPEEVVALAPGDPARALLLRWPEERT